MPSGVLLVGVVAVGGWGGSDDPQPSGSQIGSQARRFRVISPPGRGRCCTPRWARAAPQGAGRRSAAVARLGTLPPGVPDCGIGDQRVRLLRPVGGTGAMGPAMCARALSSPPVVREEGLPPVRGRSSRRVAGALGGTCKGEGAPHQTDQT